MEKMIDTKLGRCSVEYTEDGTFSSFNHDHYRKVMRAKGEEEINKHRFNAGENGFMKESHYAKTMGSGMKYQKNGQTYFVQAVHKHWLRGYYIMLLSYNIMDNGHTSHSTLWIENINSKNEDVLESIEEHKDIVFEESSIQEKLDIMITNREKSDLPCVIHINRFDAPSIETVDITTHPDINGLIEKHKLSKEPLLLSGGMSWVEMQYTNFAMDVIDLKGIHEETYNDLDMLFIHRSFEY